MLIILLYLIFIGTVLGEDGKCEVEIDGKYYDRVTMKGVYDKGYSLAVDYSTNKLYFSRGVNGEFDDFQTSCIDLNSDTFHDVKGVTSGFSQTVDQKNHDVYIGGNDGIYKFNHHTKVAESIGGKGISIWTMFYKEMLYYSTFPNQFLYILKGKDSERFKDLEDTKVDNFIIDNEDVIYFTNDTGLFSQKKGTKEAHAVAFEKLVRALNVDINGNPYLCTDDGIYRIIKHERVVELMFNIENPFGFTFDNDNNIVYSNDTNIIKLRPSKKNCLETKH